MSPLVSGALLALASAIAFGATTPLIGRFGAHLGPWSIAALLYIGAALAARPSVQPASREHPIARRSLQRIVVTGVLGAMLAPAALAWGIAQTGALSASLVLALESVFTVILAVLIFHEDVGRRVYLAVACITAGAMLLVAANGGGGFGALGLLAVTLATLLWAIDNAITGTIAGTDPSTIVVLKSTTGIIGSIALALLTREPLPSAYAGVALIATGALGYGASLRWYLLAQRRFGVARTASLFAVAPFIGSAIAYALGERTATGPPFALAAVLIAAGVALHLGERHEHAHLHRHADLVHAHPHAPGEHHVHEHEQP
jgi:drug/metabolite transporter (DMT)-like permease